MSKTEVVKYEKGLTTRVLILFFILGFASFIVNAFTWYGVGITLEPFYGGRIGAPIYMPFGFAWLILLIFEVMKKKLTPAEAAILIGLLFLISDSPFLFATYMEYIIGLPHASATDAKVAELLTLMPSFLVPKDPTLVEPAYTGGAGIPGALMPYLAFAMFLMIIYLLYQFFLATVASEQFVKVEKLPFPGVVPVVELTKISKISSITENKILYLGIILGFLNSLITTINYITPMFKVFFAYGQIYFDAWDKFWRGLNPSTGDWWMFIMADTAVFYLAPLDVSATSTIWLGIMTLIYPFIAVGAGWVTPGKNPGWTGPFQWRFMSLYCVPLALGLWSLIFGYKVYIGSLKKAFEKRSGAAEEGEIPPLWAWGGLIGVLLIWLILWLGIGASGLVILVAILSIFITLGQARVYAETGQWASSAPPYMTRYLVVGAFPENPWKSTAGWATMASANHIYGGAYLAQASHCTWGSLQVYNLGYATKTKPKDVFVGQLLAYLFMVIVGFPVVVSLVFSIGANKLGNTWFVSRLVARNSKVWDMYGVINKGGLLSTERIGMFVLALILVGLLWFLRTKYAWFFITPVALFFYSGMWFLSAAPAFILKLITLKVFGVKAYEKYGVPLAVGYLVGLSFGAFLGVTLLTFYKAPWA